MNGFGYMPICSSSGLSKSYKVFFDGVTAHFFR